MVRAMHRWAAAFLASNLCALACGPSGSPASTEGGGASESMTAGTAATGTAATGPTEAGTTAAGEPLDYGKCAEPLDSTPDVFESPDTPRFMALLTEALVAAGYGEAARVEHGQMRSNNTVQFCAKVSVRSHWFATADDPCFKHGSDDEMRAQFTSYLAEWSPLPDTMISLEAVEATVNGCFTGIFNGYQPCKTDTWYGHKFELTYSDQRWVNNCKLEFYDATVDLGTGELVRCETQIGGGCEEEG